MMLETRLMGFGTNSRREWQNVASYLRLSIRRASEVKRGTSEMVKHPLNQRQTSGGHFLVKYTLQ